MYGKLASDMEVKVKDHGLIFLTSDLVEDYQTLSVSNNLKSHLKQGHESLAYILAMFGSKVPENAHNRGHLGHFYPASARPAFFVMPSVVAEIFQATIQNSCYDGSWKARSYDQEIKTKNLVEGYFWPCFMCSFSPEKCTMNS